MRYTVYNESMEYIFSTKFINKLFDWCEEILIYDRPKTLDEAIENLEKSKFILISK